ncbi:two-component system activity regulator YycH [Bacillus sp. FSL W7-1360]
MRYERLKTLVLISLVVLSGWLTYQLWIFQPKIDDLDMGKDDKGADHVRLGDQRKIVDLLRPSQMVIHSGPSQYYLINSKEKSEKLLSDIKKSKWVEMAENVDEMPSEGIEVIFPVSVPVTMLFEQSNVEEEIGFVKEKVLDRLFLYEDEKKDAVLMQFTSDNEDEVHTVSIEMSRAHFEAYLAVDEKSEVHAEIGGGDVQEDTFSPRWYVTAEAIEMDRYERYIDRLSADGMTKLFLEDGVITKGNVNGNRISTDGRRTVTVDAVQNFLEYDYQLSVESDGEPDTHILESSVSFINLFGGWTDQYMVGHWTMNTYGGEVEFYLYDNGYPIFPYPGMNEPMKMWIKREGTSVRRYERPLIRLGQSIQISKPLMSPGVDVLTELDRQKVTVTDLKLGYDVKLSVEADRLIFEPRWFYKDDDGVWHRFLWD